MNNIEEFPFKSIFASDITKLETNALDTYISKASLDNLKPLMPSNIDFNVNKDLIGCVLNAAVAGYRNANGDSISNKTAIKIAKYFNNKYVNIAHKKDLIKGCIVNVGFSEFQTDKLLSEEEVINTNNPFNISLAIVLWKTALPSDFINLLESSVNPLSNQYKSISASWELLFKTYDIAIGPQDVNKANIITDEQEKEKLEEYLQANGGAGKKDDQYVYRVIKGESEIDFLVPTGIGLVRNPAASVQGLEIIEASVNQDEAKNSKIFTKSEKGVNINNDINKIKYMDKITKITDITDESLKTIQANVITDFINSEISKKDQEFKIELDKHKDTEKSLVDTQKELAEVQANLKKLQEEASQRAALDTFNQRMTYLEDTYEFSSDERKIVAEEIKNLNEDEFNKAKDKYVILFKDKNKETLAAKKKKDDAKEEMHEKDCSCAKCKAKAEKKSEASQEVIDEALKNAKKEGIQSPNAAEPAKSFAEEWAEAFKVENCVEIRK